MSVEDQEPEKARLDIDWVRTLAAALAAMSSAVLLSTLGAVGTVIGAAVGSLIATVGTTLYAQGLARSKEKVALAQEIALGRIGIAQTEVRRAQRRGPASATGAAHLDHADEELAAAKEELAEAGESDADEPEGPGWRERLGGLPWRRIGVFAAAVFLVVLLAITVFEQLAGRSVSSYTGGSDDRRSTIFGGDRSDDEPDRRERDRPSDESPTPESEAPVETDDTSEVPEPSEEPTEEPTETEGTPTETTPTEPPPTTATPTEPAD